MSHLGGILCAIVMGAIIGWLASLITKSEGGLLRNIILGIAGSAVGSFLFDIIGIQSSNTIGQIIIGTIGAIILIFVVEAILKSKK